MPTSTQKKIPTVNRVVKSIRSVLLSHFPENRPGNEVLVERYSPVTVKVRIVSDRFSGKSFAEREEMALKVLGPLGRDTIDFMGTLTTLTPDEFGNHGS